MSCLCWRYLRGVYVRQSWNLAFRTPFLVTENDIVHCILILQGLCPGDFVGPCHWKGEGGSDPEGLHRQSWNLAFRSAMCDSVGFIRPCHWTEDSYLWVMSEGLCDVRSLVGHYGTDGTCPYACMYVRLLNLNYRWFIKIIIISTYKRKEAQMKAQPLMNPRW